MGAGRIGEIAAAPRSTAGSRRDTPVAAVRNGTRPDQQHGPRHARDDRRRRRAARRARSSSATVAALDLAWFEARPLFGRSVVVTRAREQASELRARLEALGAEVLELPAIAIEPLDVHACPTSTRYDWLVFTSANGVRRVLRPRPRARGLDARALARRAGRGDRPGTARALADARDPSPTSCPSGSSPSRCSTRSPTRARRARACCSPAPSRRATCCPRGSRERGYAVDVLPVYRTVRAEPDADALARVRAGDGRRDHVHVVVDRRQLLRPASAPLPDPQPLVVSIGPVTSETARGRGLRVDAEADRPHHRRPRRHAPRRLASPVADAGDAKTVEAAYHCRRDVPRAAPAPAPPHARAAPPRRRGAARRSTTSSRRCS